MNKSDWNDYKRAVRRYTRWQKRFCALLLRMNDGSIDALRLANIHSRERERFIEAAMKLAEAERIF